MANVVWVCSVEVIDVLNGMLLVLLEELVPLLLNFFSQLLVFLVDLILGNVNLFWRFLAMNMLLR